MIVRRRFSLGTLREVFSQRRHDCESRRIIERGVVISVRVRDDPDVLVGRARQRREGRHGFEIVAHLRLEVHFQFHRIALRDQVAQRLAVFPSDEKSRHPNRRIASPAAHALPDREIFVVAPDREDRRRAQVSGAPPCAFPACRFAHVSGLENRKNQHRLTAHVAPHEVGGAAGADPHGFSFESTGRRRRRPDRRIQRLERKRFAAARRGDIPIKAEPLRRKRVHLLVDVRQPVLPPLRLGPCAVIFSYLVPAMRPQ